jgi:hypothetical protein
MSDHLRASQLVFVLENADQSFDTRKLSVGRISFLKVPDKANADAVLVVFVIRTLGVSTMNLLSPSKSGLNLSIIHPLPVSD